MYICVSGTIQTGLNPHTDNLKITLPCVTINSWIQTGIYPQVCPQRTGWWVWVTHLRFYLFWLFLYSYLAIVSVSLEGLKNLRWIQNATLPPKFHSQSIISSNKANFPFFVLGFVIWKYLSSFLCNHCGYNNVYDWLLGINVQDPSRGHIFIINVPSFPPILILPDYRTDIVFRFLCASILHCRLHFYTVKRKKTGEKVLGGQFMLFRKKEIQRLTKRQMHRQRQKPYKTSFFFHLVQLVLGNVFSLVLGVSLSSLHLAWLLL